ncbi:hypothetical protein [uncultured Shimia sp.]|uniref:hypothetical protein n=1 Tax=uncultured Shimia sp. TaxID=573152 RepID=UPI0025D427ED|nr:hypothetical protein [uncultured Shimia sp.]
MSSQYSKGIGTRLRTLFLDAVLSLILLCLLLVFADKVMGHTPEPIVVVLMFCAMWLKLSFPVVKTITGDAVQFCRRVMGRRKDDA